MLKNFPLNFDWRQCRCPSLFLPPQKMAGSFCVSLVLQSWKASKIDAGTTALPAKPNDRFLPLCTRRFLLPTTTTTVVTLSNSPYIYAIFRHFSASNCTTTRPVKTNLHEPVAVLERVPCGAVQSQLVDHEAGADGVGQILLHRYR